MSPGHGEAGDDRRTGPPTYGVAELGRRVQDALAAGLPRQVWVRGEVQDLRRTAKGHLFFALVEKHERAGGPAGRLEVALWASSWWKVKRTLERAGLALADGIEVRVLGSVVFHPAVGRIRLQMVAIDAVHTLGALEAERQRVLQVLADDGLLDRNRSRPLPLVPRRIALVTSAGSAAQRDVLHELEASGLGFQVLLADARVQGPEAEGSLHAALLAVAARADDVDVVLLARGGGSRADLGAFDRERVARAVAAMPVPVVAAIGHETDRSVVDRCAHVSVKTPTAGAAWCVERVQRYVDATETCWSRIAERAGARVTAAQHHVDDRAGRVRWATSTRLTRAEERVGAGAGRLEATARLRLEHHHRRVDDLRARTLNGASRRLAAAAETLRTARERTAGLATRAVVDAERRLDALATQARLLDPAQVLARGWSITRTDGGHLVRDPADAPAGTRLVTTTRGGDVRSTVDGA